MSAPAISDVLAAAGLYTLGDDPSPEATAVVLQRLQSLTQEHTFGQQVVAPHTRPMQVARELVRNLYQTQAGLVLRDHRGDFYRYDGTCWPEIEARLVRAATYKWLENASYEKETNAGTVLQSWDPTRYKVTNVRSSPELCVKVRGSSSMLLLGCLGDLLRFEKREIQVATFAPGRSSP